VTKERDELRRDRERLLQLAKEFEHHEVWMCGNSYYNRNEKAWRNGPRSERYIGGLHAADFPHGHKIAICTVHEIGAAMKED